jgi:MSHA biogenesis protein MshK
MKPVNALVTLGLAMAATGLAYAQTLPDPTRPPAGFNLAVGAAAPAQAAPDPLVLESVLIHPDTRIAIINGERLRLGQKIRGLRLVRIADSEVVLLEGSERRTLKLYPGVRKKPTGAGEPPPTGG